MSIVREELIKQARGLMQIFPVKETNRTHSKGYVEDLPTKKGGKRMR